MISVLQIVSILAHIKYKYVLGVGGGDWSNCNCFSSVMLKREVKLCCAAHCCFQISCWNWKIFPSIMFINDYLQGFKTCTNCFLSTKKFIQPKAFNSHTLLSLRVHYFHFTRPVSRHMVSITTFSFRPIIFLFQYLASFVPSSWCLPVVVVNIIISHH